tara:strand:- start:28 stop:270 length:243 start_codon:yes stop_codon:yes gene_type:complete
VDFISVVAVLQLSDHYQDLIKQSLLDMVVEVVEDIVVEDRMVLKTPEVVVVLATEIMVDLVMVVLELFLSHTTLNKYLKT